MVTPVAGINALEITRADENASVTTLTLIRSGEQQFSDNMISFFPFLTPDNDPVWKEKLDRPRGRAKKYQLGMNIR